MPCSKRLSPALKRETSSKGALPGGTVVGCATPESVRAAKVASGREKDALDIAEIDRIGYDPARYARVTAAYEVMRIACVAYGE